MRGFAWLLISMVLASPLARCAAASAEDRRKPTSQADDPAASEALPSFGADEFLLVPLRIHMLESDHWPSINAQITARDLFRIVAKANRIWQAAGIRLVIESIVREPAADQELFAYAETLTAVGNLGRYLILRPEPSQSDEMLHVYYVHEMEVNGVFLGAGVSFVQETARLRPVEGGIDEPVPRVMSHELGHAFGLPHRQDRTNLMASGTTGTSLSADEVRRARERASRFSFARTAEKLAQQARQHFDAGRWFDALMLDLTLLNLPGNSSLKDEARVRSALGMHGGPICLFRSGLGTAGPGREVVGSGGAPPPSRTTGATGSDRSDRAGEEAK